MLPLSTVKPSSTSAALYELIEIDTPPIKLNQLKKLSDSCSPPGSPRHGHQFVLGCPPE